MPPEAEDSAVPESQVSDAPADLGGIEDSFESAFTAAQASATVETPAAAAASPPPANASAAAAHPAAPEFTPEQYRELQSRLQELEPMARYGQSLAPYMPDISRYLAERDQPQQRQPEPEPDAFDPQSFFKEQWNVPEITDQMQFAIDNGVVQMDESGKYTATPGYEAMAMPILADLNHAHISHRQQVAGLFKGNFPEKVYGMLEKPLMHKIEQMLGERFGQYQTEQQQQQQIEQFRQAHEAVLYAKDQRTGATTLSPQGQAFTDSMRMLEDAGVTDQAQLLKLASKMAGLNAQPAGVVGARPNGRDGSAPSPAPTPAAKDPRQSFLDNALANASHAPQASAGYTGAGAAPVTVGRSELEQMFAVAHQQAQA